jgi:hypothetical protein
MGEHGGKNTRARAYDGLVHAELIIAADDGAVGVVAGEEETGGGTSKIRPPAASNVAAT